MQKVKHSIDIPLKYKESRNEARTWKPRGDRSQKTICNWIRHYVSFLRADYSLTRNIWVACAKILPSKSRIIQLQIRSNRRWVTDTDWNALSIYLIGSLNVILSYKKSYRNSYKIPDVSNVWIKELE